MLFVESLVEEEAILARGVSIYAEITWTGSAFKFVGDRPANVIRTAAYTDSYLVYLIIIIINIYLGFHDGWVTIVFKTIINAIMS